MRQGVRRLSRFCDGLAGLGLALGLAILLAALFGERFPALDLASLAVLPAACVSLAGGCWLLVRARSLTARLLLSVCLMPGVAALLPGPARAPCAPSMPRLRVAWINAHNPADARPILAWIARERPQIAGVAEVEPGARALRAGLAARYPHWHSCLANTRCSTVLYAAVRPERMEGLARGDPENRKALSAVSMTFAAAGRSRPVQILAAHLSRPLPLGRQRAELAELEAALQPAADTIVMGDFNMPPRMRALRAFAARSGLDIVSIGRPTWPERVGGAGIGGLWQIDQLLLGRGWRVSAIRRSPDLDSDHRGYVADVCRVSAG